MLRITLTAAAIAVAMSSTVCANTNDAADREVQREFRFFRIQVYKTFRTERPEYDLRREAGEQAMAAWQQSGAQAEQVEPLLTWYRDAKQVSLPGMNMPLPPLPEFPQAVAVAPVVPAQLELTLRDVEQQQTKQQREEDTKVYHVREIPSRSIEFPYSLNPPKSDVQAAKPGGTPAWRSVSRALFQGMTFGSSRATSGQ